MTDSVQNPLAGMRILVVEDTANLALGTADWLRRLGATVDVRASVVQAKKRLEQVAFDLVVLDYNLVGSATGTDLAIWMLNHPDLKHILRVSLSGADPYQILQDAPEGVYHAVIAKTVPIRELTQRILALFQDTH